MDPLPLIPENHANHEVAPILRTVLQDTLVGQVYPKQVADQFLIDTKIEDLNVKLNAKYVLEIYDRAQDIASNVQQAAADVMFQHALYLTEKEKIDESLELREKIKLQRCKLFKQLEEEFVLDYNLIQSSDLFQSMICRYLDYRNHEHTVCPACRENVQTKYVKQRRNKQIKRSLQSVTVTLIKKRGSFQVKPKCVVFHNYQLDQIYKRNIKIINTSSIIQSIAIKSLPISPYFSVVILNNQRLAPGMSVTAVVTFKPKIFRMIEDSLVLKNKDGEMIELELACTRDLPKLITCIFKSNSNVLDRCQPGSNHFMEKRKEALNSTIDCGSCLVSQYVLVSIILENKGIDGKFFIMTEDDWFFQNIESISTTMELFKGDFWIYPTYFEIHKDEIVEINIIFQPTKPGLQVETLYFICDNNSFEQIELMGDAIEFSKNFIEIDVPPDKCIHRKSDYCVYFGNVKKGTSQNLIIVVRNKSYLLLSCKWTFSHKSVEGVEEIKENWITQKNYQTKLSPYRTVQYEFTINFDAKKSGYHNIIFNFYITNIPLIALEENEEFLCIEQDHIIDKTLSKAVDVLVKEIQLCAMIETVAPKPVVECWCDTDLKPPPQKMGFSCPFIKFGILPTGLNVQKEFFIRNDTNINLNWTMLEVKYNLDSSPHMEVIKKSPHLSEYSGFCPKRRNRKLFYKTINKKPASWVSILVLISLNQNMESNIEDVCLVTYEMINFDIVINTKHSKYTIPALMPAHVMYRGIPIELEFNIENRSPITGYFQFFPPFGEDRDRLLVELTPSFSSIKPLESIPITAKLVCSDIGFIQNFFIPCFVGLGQEPLVFRVLCTVDGPHVVFFLPVEKNHVKKITWPPKLVYEYDTDPWCNCKYKECMEGEDPGFFFSNYQDVPFNNLLNHNQDTDATYTLSDSENKKSNKQSDKSLAESQRSTVSSDSANSGRRRLEGIISEEFDTENILHDDIVEVHNVPLLTPKKITVYIQNITPIATKFTLEPQRFVENKKFDHVAVRLHLKKREELWNDLMGTEYGILVQPDITNGILNPYELAKVDIWIYANTYGIYSEEIIVDLVEMPSYHFSMLIEIVGSPLVLPMAINCITKYPTLRFGTVPFDSKSLTRDIKITNKSSIPVLIMWHSLMKSPNDPDFDSDDAFNIFLQMATEENSEKVLELVLSMDEYGGKNTSDFCYIEPSKTDIKEHSTVHVRVFIKPEFFDVGSNNVDVVSCLVGHLFLKPEHRKKANYFLRKTGTDVNSLKIETTITLEKPNLELEIGGAPFVKMRMYANDVLLNKNECMQRYTVLRNLGGSSYLLELSIEEPFYFKNSKNELKNEFVVNITAGGTIELIICCCIHYPEMLALSELIYDNCCISDKYPFCKKLSDWEEVCQIDYLEKIIRITKKMTIVRSEGIIQFPMVVYIYFPRIYVSPTALKFDTVLLNTTFKRMITIYNYTGYAVKFEIYKSSGARSFLVVPHYGEVPACLGNPSFVNVFLYFCPNECREYKESLRVVTNIPNYFAEIQLRGMGSLNAKFAINYKI